MIDIEKLADEFLHGADRNGAYYGFVEELKQFSEAYAAKMLEDKEREIAELKKDRERLDWLQINWDNALTRENIDKVMKS